MIEFIKSYIRSENLLYLDPYINFDFLSYVHTLLPSHNHTHNNQPYPIHTQYQTCKTSQQYKLTKNQD